MCIEYILVTRGRVTYTYCRHIASYIASYICCMYTAYIYRMPAAQDSPLIYIPHTYCVYTSPYDAYLRRGAALLHIHCTYIAHILLIRIAMSSMPGARASPLQRRTLCSSCAHTDGSAASCLSNSLCQHTSAYVSIRQHTSAYVSIRQHTSAYVSIRQHTSAYVSIRQHTSAYVSMRTLDI
jgi:hypothetical protein